MKEAIHTIYFEAEGLEESNVANVQYGMFSTCTLKWHVRGSVAHRPTVSTISYHRTIRLDKCELSELLWNNDGFLSALVLGRCIT